MRIGIPNEIAPDESRVALTPSLVPLLTQDGHEVSIETGAGSGAHCADEDFARTGARIVADAVALYAQAEVVFKVRPPRQHPGANMHETQMLRESTIYVGLLDPMRQLTIIEQLAEQRVTAYALELVPRIARAQPMDALTAMATVAGYKAVLVAAERLPKMLPLLMTAAGTVAPATVLVMGAGVAGLQAIATARRLGARVEAFDPRPAVREQIQSLGATFIEMPAAKDEAEEIETAGGYAREQSAAFLQRERESIWNDVEPLLQQAQADHERSTVERLVDAVQAGALGVAGLELTQVALERGQADVLVLADQAPLTPDARSHLIALAARTDAAVEVVDQSEPLLRLGGVGALLRYR
jgi:NAD(P) transhydrogenase subunit alpha